MLGEVDGHETKEIEEQFFDALGESAVADSALLDGVQFKQKKTICGAKALTTERMVSRKKLAADDAHQFHEMVIIFFRKGQARLAQFYHREVGCSDGIAYRG